MINENTKEKSGIDLYNFDTAISLVEKEVEDAILSSPFMVRNYIKHLLMSKGKFIRAVSLITCAQDRDGLISTSAVKLAAAVEILHLATLVHDDVIDDADIRRGISTLNKKFGKRTAVICGDYLFSIALKITSSFSNKKDYLDIDIPDYIAKICAGELSQQMNNGNYDLSEYRYLKIISGKTSALFEASFHAGAVLSGASDKEIDKFRRLGRNTGMIFQLIDDCMDFETTKNIAKKPVQSDFERKVITLPMIYAFKNLPALKEKVKLSEVNKREVNEAVLKLGGIFYTRTLAQKYYNKSLQIINELDITEDKRFKLIAILKKVFRVF